MNSSRFLGSTFYTSILNFTAVLLDVPLPFHVRYIISVVLMYEETSEGALYPSPSGTESWQHWTSGT